MLSMRRLPHALSASGWRKNACFQSIRSLLTTLQLWEQLSGTMALIGPLSYGFQAPTFPSTTLSRTSTLSTHPHSLMKVAPALSEGQSAPPVVYVQPSAE